MKAVSFLVILLTIALLLPACVSQAAPATSFLPVPADYSGKNNPLGADAAEAGKVNFNTYCESCHGAAGLGDGTAGQALNPPPANLPHVAALVGDDYLFWRISEGKLGTPMVSWAGVLSEEQIWQVVAYIRTLK